MLIFLTIAFSLIKSVMLLTIPTGCGLKDGVFTCDYKQYIVSRTNEFDPQPQRLVIDNIDGGFTSTSFKNFDQVNRTAFDPDYTSSLTLSCVPGGSAQLSLDNTSFSGMSFFQDIRIVNCKFNTIPAGAFTRLGNVNSLVFERGTIDDLDVNAFRGVNIVKDVSLPDPKGEFALLNTKVIQGKLPLGVLDPFANASSLTLNNCGLRELQLTLFRQMRYLSRLSLNNNLFTYIQKNIFLGMQTLSVISMDNIAWACSCPSLWFLQTAADQRIQLKGDMLCSLPNLYYRQRITTYQQNECGSVVACQEGTFPLSGTCMTWLHILSFSITFLSFLVLIVCVICIITNRRAIFRKKPARAFVKSLEGHRSAPRKVCPYNT